MISFYCLKKLKLGSLINALVIVDKWDYFTQLKLVSISFISEGYYI